MFAPRLFANLSRRAAFAPPHDIHHFPLRRRQRLRTIARHVMRLPKEGKLIVMSSTNIDRRLAVVNALVRTGKASFARVVELFQRYLGHGVGSALLRCSKRVRTASQA